MKSIGVALFASILCMPPVVTAQEEDYPSLVKVIPYLTERLRSTRWEARYLLVSELTGRNDETRRALETLVQDPDERVAGQAVAIYLNSAVNVVKSVFVPGRYPRNYRQKAGGPMPIPDEAVRGRCLARLRLPKDPAGGGGRESHPGQTPSPVDDPNISEDITILGIIGKPEDTVALYPYLQSSYPFVAITAARSVIRLGDKEKGREALCRLAERDPSSDLFYVTEALYILKELDHPGLKEMTLKILASIDRGKPIQPNWVSRFLLLAADIAGNEVWKGGEKGDSGDRPR